MIVVVAVVAGAAAFLIVRGVRLLWGSKKPVCGSCGSCPAAPNDQASQPPGFVPLETLRREGGLRPST
jgi:hypothetical protein